ncbi:MAG: cytochrome P450 [Solirubrobacterales bacterium]
MANVTTTTEKPAGEVGAAAVKNGGDGETLPVFSLPDGPNTPAIINGFNFFVRREASSKSAQRKYGDVWTSKLPGIGTAVFVADPELIKTIYTAKPDVLHAGNFPLGEVLGPGSLFSMDEDEHLKERRLLLKPFHGDRLRDFEDVFREEAVRGFASWEDDKDFATMETFNEITVRVILRSVFGATGGALAELQTLLPRAVRLGQAVAAISLFKKNVGPWSPAGRLAGHREHLQRIVDDLTRERLKDPNLGERPDILSMMLESMLNDDEVIDTSLLADELTTLLAAGHETTGSSLAWAVERIRRHPAVLRRLEAEIESGGSEYRTATILEVLRSRPVIGGHVRRVVKPFQLGQWHLAPGTVLFPDIATIHSDDRHHANADSFDPGRYLGSKPENYSWIPFGGGVRRCLGAAFAQLEMDVVLAELISSFEILPTDARPERSIYRGIASGPSKGGVVRVRRRRVPLTAQHAPRALTCPIDH